MKKIIFIFILLLISGNLAYASGSINSAFGPDKTSSISNIDASIPNGTFDLNGVSTITNDIVSSSSDSSSSSFSSCSYSEGIGLSSFLNGCKPRTLVGSNGETMTIEGGFRDTINEWIINISLVLGVLAVGSLVYAALLMQFSGGEDELIKKSKNIIKWTMIGFILLLSASGIIYVVINVMFGLGD